jgi:hypothetical protein
MLNDLNFEIYVSDVSVDTRGLIITLTLCARWPKGVREGRKSTSDRHCLYCGDLFHSAGQDYCPECEAEYGRIANDCRKCFFFPPARLSASGHRG